MERHGSSGIVGGTDFGYGRKRRSFGIFLHPSFPVATNFDAHVVGESVDAGYAHAVETATDLVAAFVELASGMENRHDDLQSRTFFLFVHSAGNTSSGVGHGNGIVGVDCDGDVLAEASHGFVYGVVDDLGNQVMQAFDADVADIHCRTFAYGLQAFEDLNAIGAVFLFFFLFAHDSNVTFKRFLMIKQANIVLLFLFCKRKRTGSRDGSERKEDGNEGERKWRRSGIFRQWREGTSMEHAIMRMKKDKRVGERVSEFLYLYKYMEVPKKDTE